MEKRDRSKDDSRDIKSSWYQNGAYKTFKKKKKTLSSHALLPHHPENHWVN